MPAALPFSQKTWLSQTSVTALVRSGEMKAIDDALFRYEKANTQPNFDKIRDALNTWKRKQGADWRTSKRNQHGAITDLDRFIHPNFYAPADTATSYEAGLADSRHGLLWLFSNTELHVGPTTFLDVLLEGGFNIGGAAAGLTNLKTGDGYLSDKAAMITGDTINGASTAVNAARANSKKNDAPGIILKIRQYLLDFAESVKDYLKGLWESSVQEKLETAWGFVTTVANTLASHLWSKVAPFLGGSIDAANGIIATIKACKARYKVYASGKGVRMNSGHAGAIVSQLKTAMDFAIGQGLYQTLRGAATVTAEAITAGGASVASLVAACLEFLAKMIYRIVEVSRMKNFFEACRKQYGELGGDPASHAFFRNGVAFGEWYSGVSRLMPCIPALAITSGVVGDKMRFINMYSAATHLADTRGGGKEASNVVSQSTFDKGVEHLDLLKDWAKDYLVDAKYRFYSQNSTAAMYLDYWRETKPREIGVALPI